MLKSLFAILAVCSCLALSAQEAPGLGAPGADSSFSLGGGDEAMAPQVTGQVVKDELRVTYVIPEGHHMVLQEDFVFIKLKTAGYQLGKTIYPAGRPSQDGGQEYVGTVVLAAPLQRTAEAAQAAKKLEVSAGYQICNDAGTCLPPAESTVTVEVDPAKVTGAATPASAVPETGAKPEGKSSAGQEGIDPDSGFLRFSPERLEQELKAGKPVFIDFGARWCATCRVNENTVLYTETVRDAFKSHGVVAMRADYTNKDPLITEWLRKYRRAGVPMYLYYRAGAAEPEVLPELLTKDLVLAAVSGQSVTASGAPLTLWVALLFAFIGGIILNVMPCVLPVLSLKALSLVEGSRKEPGEMLKGALAYTGGVLVCFAILAGLVIGLKSAGELVGWGFQFQNWKFVLALVAMVWLFALSLFEVFVISLPGQAAAAEASQKSGHWGSFLSGAVAVLLATPCTAPFLGSALGYAFSQPAPLILLFFLMIGLGLALPFLVLGFFPGATRWIPRPGNWMTVFREIMAFLLVATVVWLLDILHSLVGAGLLPVLWYLLLLALAAWIYGQAAFAVSSLRRWILVLLAVLLAVLPLHWLNRSLTAAQERLSASASQLR